LDEEFGLVSAFHAHAQDKGCSETPTFFQYGWETRPYHIDYCFIPKGWVPFLRSVEIGSHAEWIGQSDHRPLVIDLDVLALSGGARSDPTKTLIT
jgi:endonuclease/exonuclease/phosphatase family metal-dependent hydrolase